MVFICGFYASAVIACVVGVAIWSCRLYCSEFKVRVQVNRGRMQNFQDTQSCQYLISEANRLCEAITSLGARAIKKISDVIDDLCLTGDATEGTPDTHQPLAQLEDKSSSTDPCPTSCHSQGIQTVEYSVVHTSSQTTITHDCDGTSQCLTNIDKAQNDAACISTQTDHPDMASDDKEIQTDEVCKDHVSRSSQTKVNVEEAEIQTEAVVYHQVAQLSDGSCQTDVVDDEPPRSTSDSGTGDSDDVDAARDGSREDTEGAAAASAASSSAGSAAAEVEVPTSPAAEADSWMKQQGIVVENTITTAGNATLYNGRFGELPVMIKRVVSSEGAESRPSGSDPLSQARIELSVSLDMDHPFIISTVMAEQKSNFIVLLREKHSRGTLRGMIDRLNNLRGRSQGSLTEWELEELSRFVCACLIQGCIYLHEQHQIVHRNIHPDAIHINDRGYAVIGDLSQARGVREKKERLHGDCGTVGYQPPEVIADFGHRYPCDFWQLGCIVYEILVGYSPYSDEEVDKIRMRTVLEPDYAFSRLQRHDMMGMETKRFIKRLLDPIPWRRSNKEIWNHKWFDRFNWDLLNQQELRSPINSLMAQSGDGEWRCQPPPKPSQWKRSPPRDSRNGQKQESRRYGQDQDSNRYNPPTNRYDQYQRHRHHKQDHPEAVPGTVHVLQKQKDIQSPVQGSYDDEYPPLSQTFTTPPPGFPQMAALAPIQPPTNQSGPPELVMVSQAEPQKIRISPTRTEPEMIAPWNIVSSGAAPLSSVQDHVASQPGLIAVPPPANTGLMSQPQLLSTPAPMVKLERPPMHPVSQGMKNPPTFHHIHQLFQSQPAPQLTPEGAPAWNMMLHNIGNTSHRGNGVSSNGNHGNSMNTNGNHGNSMSNNGMSSNGNHGNIPNNNNAQQCSNHGNSASNNGHHGNNPGSDGNNGGPSVSPWMTNSGLQFPDRWQQLEDTWQQLTHK